MFSGLLIGQKQKQNVFSRQMKFVFSRVMLTFCSPTLSRTFWCLGMKQASFAIFEFASLRSQCRQRKRKIRTRVRCGTSFAEPRLRWHVTTSAPCRKRHFGISVMSGIDARTGAKTTDFSH
jgi:hypothetical protein